MDKHLVARLTRFFSQFANERNSLVQYLDVYKRQFLGWTSLSRIPTVASEDAKVGCDAELLDVSN